MLKTVILNATKKVGYFAKNELLCMIDDHKVKELVKKTQSPKITEQILAKAKLKKFYPEVWDVLNEN